MLTHKVITKLLNGAIKQRNIKMPNRLSSQLVTALKQLWWPCLG